MAQNPPIMAETSVSYPGTSVALGMVGGAVYLVVGVIAGIVGAVAAVFNVWPAAAVTGLVAGLVIVGVLTLVFSYLLRRQPELGLIWGILLIVLALVSLPLFFGGFVVGFLLTLVAGILALTGKLGPMIASGSHAE